MPVAVPHVPDLVISDCHFGHTNISKYCQRLSAAQPDPLRVDEAMFNNWTWACEKFRHEHGRQPVILHLGDLADRTLREGRTDYIADLPGDKYTLRGNHDEWEEDRLNELGFQLVEPFSFGHKSFLIVVTHHPMRRVDGATINVHGHTHNNPFNSASRHHRNVSVECVAFTPQPFLKLVESSIRLVSDVPDHLDYHADEEARAIHNNVRLAPAP